MYSLLLKRLKSPRKKMLFCRASACESKIMWGSSKWTKQWVSVWVESKRRSYDACSIECADNIKEEQAGHD